MAEIVRTLQKPSTTTARSPDQVRGRDVVAYRRLVKIGGKTLQDEYLDQALLSLTVDRTARGLSKARVVFANNNQSFTDHELLQGGLLEIEIYVGYVGTRMQRKGTYYAAMPRYCWGNPARSVIELDCFSEEWLLARGEKREVYEGLRDSQIAQRIARRNRLRADIEETSPVYDHVLQANMSDMAFLESRALLYGYDVYIEDGTLHFHAPRVDDTKLTLYYGNGEKGIIQSFNVTVDPWVNGSAWTKSGIDRVTGEAWEFTASGELDDVAKYIKRSGGPGFKTGTELARFQDGSSPTKFIVGSGHALSAEEGRQQARGIARAAEWVAIGSGAVRGIEVLRPRSLVRLQGLSHLSGDYYVTRVIDTLDDRGYRTQFEVTRPGVGQLKDRLRAGGESSRRDVTDQSSQAGTVRLG